MTSLAGCSGENFASILRSLGYVVERREGPPITAPLLPKAATEPLAPHSADAASSDVEAAVPAPEAIDDESLAAASDGSESAAAETAPPEAPAEIEASAPEETPPIPAPAAASTPDEQIGDGASVEAPAASGDDFAPTQVEPPDFGLEAQVGSEEFAAAAPPDADSAAVPDEAGAAPAEPASPVLIEIWRPHRQQHHARRSEPRAGRRSAPRERAKGAAETDAAPQPESAERPAHRQDRRRTHPGGRGRQEAEVHAEGAAAPSPESGEVRPAGEATAREPRRGRAARGQSRPRFEGQRDRRDDGGRNRANDSERRHERGGDHAAAGKKPFEKKTFERPPDPNSPFAKLLALKATLEEKSKQDR